jgi:predicted esterase
MPSARLVIGVLAIALGGCGGGPGSTLDAGGTGPTSDSGRPGDAAATDAGDASGAVEQDARRFDDGLTPDARVSADSGASPDASADASADAAAPDARVDDLGRLRPDAAVADARVLDPDARVLDPDARVLDPDAAPPPDPDARVLNPDARVLDPDARVLDPDARVLDPDARVALPDAAPPDPDAALPPDGPPLDPIAYGGRLPVAAGAGRAVLTVAGLDREIEVYVPPRPAAQPALVLALHGTWGWGTDLVGAHRPQGFEDLADAHGFILLAPDARRIVAGDWDQHDAGVHNRTYWETLPTDDPARGADPDRNPDLLFIRAVIAEARRTYGVDPRRVYVVGHSNGGFFTQHVATVLADRIAAFASASAGLVRCPSTATCRFQGRGDTCADLRANPGYCACDGPEKPVPVPVGRRMPPGFLFHATDDDIVSVYYSCELEARMQTLGHTVESHIRDQGGGHWLPRSFSGEAWAFLSRFSL